MKVELAEAAANQMKSSYSENESRLDQIVAIPTLVRRLPLPLQTIIGDLSNSVLLLVGLDLRKVD